MLHQAEPVAETRSTPIRVRKIGHVVYEVSDIERTTRFWTEILGFTVSDTNELGMVFLRNASDHHTIALVPRAGRTRPENVDALQVHHFAMELADNDAVLEARAFLRSRNIPVVFEGRRGPGGNMGIEFNDPDGYMLELYAKMDQVDESGRSRPAAQFRRAKSLEEALENPLPETW